MVLFFKLRIGRKNKHQKSQRIRGILSIVKRVSVVELKMGNGLLSMFRKLTNGSWSTVTL